MRGRSWWWRRSPPWRSAEIPDVPFPISQIAIEIYEALPGGAYIMGRFAPDGVKVAHMRDYTPQEALGSP